MSDGPYRESTLVRAAAPHPIVLADESPSPSERLEVVDYSDWSTVVRLRGRLAPLDGGYGKFALAWIAFAVALAAVTKHPVIAVFAITWTGLRRLAPLLDRLGVTEEISIGAHGLAWRRGRRRRLVSLERVETFTLEPTALALDGDAYFAALQPLATFELAWLAARLDRAIARAKP
jgi:hypothetical protein